MSECPECGHETLALQHHDDGSGMVHCSRTDCEYEDRFTPEGAQ